MEGTRAWYTILFRQSENSDLANFRIFWKRGRFGCRPCRLHPSTIFFRQSLFLVLLGRRTRRQFPKQSEQSRGRLLVGEFFERHGGDEVRRGGVEADAHEILVTP